MQFDVGWIEDGLSKPGKSKKGLAAVLGRAQSAVTALLKGDRQLKAHEIAKIAAYLEVDPPGYEAAEVTAGPGLVPIRVQGIIDAGSWREVSEFDDVTDVWINEPRDERFPDARQLAFDVAGDSMNDLKPRPILPGDRVICVAFEDLRIPMRDGMVVVVEQTTAARMRERSVKQLELYDDRYELHPRSTNPRHKPIVIGRDLQADDGKKVEIVGLVRRITNDVPM